MSRPAKYSPAPEPTVADAGDPVVFRTKRDAYIPTLRPTSDGVNAQLTYLDGVLSASKAIQAEAEASEADARAYAVAAGQSASQASDHADNARDSKEDAEAAALGALNAETAAKTASISAMASAGIDLTNYDVGDVLAVAGQTLVPASRLELLSPSPGLVTSAHEALTLDLAQSRFFKVTPQQWKHQVSFANVPQFASVTIALEGASLTQPWALNGASYANKSLDVSGDIPDSFRGICQAGGGTSLYGVTGGTDDRVYKYSLSTPDDITTATIVPGQVLHTGAQDQAVKDLFVSADEKHLFTASSHDPGVDQWTMSTPGDLNTAVHVGHFSHAEIDSTISGLFLSPDGRFMLVAMRDSNQSIKSYKLSTPWDVTTAQYAGESPTNVIRTFDKSAICARPDGRILYNLVDNSGATTTRRRVEEYRMVKPWDVNTLVDTGVILDIKNLDDDFTGMTISDDGATFFVGKLTQSSGPEIYQFENIGPGPAHLEINPTPIIEGFPPDIRADLGETTLITLVTVNAGVTWQLKSHQQGLT